MTDFSPIENYLADKVSKKIAKHLADESLRDAMYVTGNGFEIPQGMIDAHNAMIQQDIDNPITADERVRLKLLAMAEVCKIKTMYGKAKR